MLHGSASAPHVKALSSKLYNPWCGILPTVAVLLALCVHITVARLTILQRVMSFKMALYFGKLRLLKAPAHIIKARLESLVCGLQSPCSCPYSI